MPNSVLLKIFHASIYLVEPLPSMDFRIKNDVIDYFPVYKLIPIGLIKYYCFIMKYQIFLKTSENKIFHNKIDILQII